MRAPITSGRSFGRASASVRERAAALSTITPSHPIAGARRARSVGSISVPQLG